MSQDYIAIINGLLKVAGTLPIPGAQYAGIASTLIDHISKQNGKTVDQILDDAGVQEEDNRRMLLEDLARLQGAQPVAASLPPAQPPAPAPPVPAPYTPEPPKQRTVAEIEARLKQLHTKLDATTDAGERTILESRIARNEAALAEMKKGGV